MTAPKCICGTTMVESSDEVTRGNMTLATPNGKYSCYPCSKVRTELLEAAREAFTAIGALVFVDKSLVESCGKAYSKLETAIQKAEAGGPSR